MNGNRDAPNRRGAALAEVVALIAMVIVSGALAAPTLTRARQDPRVVACAANLATLSQALGTLQQEYPGYYTPVSDDANVAASTRYGHSSVMATWIDVLQQKGYIASRNSGYCPADRLPDPLNRKRGMDWAFRYPAALGGGFGADHSYAVSLPYVTHADPARFPCWNPDGDPDRRVIAGDGQWTWTQSLGGRGLVSNRYHDPYWGSNTIAYRHKFGANLLHRDGHVALVAYDIDTADYAPACNQTGGIDTTKHFIWRSGEHPEVGYASPFNNCNNPPPGCTEYPLGSDPSPNELDPGWYTQYHRWTIPDIKEYKGWTLN